MPSRKANFMTEENKQHKLSHLITSLNHISQYMTYLFSYTFIKKSVQISTMEKSVKDKGEEVHSLSLKCEHLQDRLTSLQEEVECRDGEKEELLRVRRRHDQDMIGMTTRISVDDSLGI